MDRECFQFEREFADWHQRRDSILFNSGGSANLAILMALKNLGRLKAGDRVGFTALTWSTNVMPIIQHGLAPVPLDVSPVTMNAMVEHVAKRLDEVDLQALFITNVLGFTGDLPALADLCRKRRILLLEDNCEALGTRLGGRLSGNFGLAASSSFFVAHHMSTIEGGMAITDDLDLGEMLRIVRANGWDRNLTSEQQAKWRARFDIPNEFEAKYAFYDLGFNLRPTEITGFLGRRQLKYLTEGVRLREENYHFLADVLCRNPIYLPLDRRHIERLSSFAFPVLCRTPQLREAAIKRFTEAGVEVRPMIAGNIQRQPFFRKYVSRVYDLPGADLIHDCGFYFLDRKFNFPHSK